MCLHIKTKHLLQRRYGKIKLRKIDDPMTELFGKAVDAAIHAAQVSGNPIARYDRTKGVPYLEYPDGSRSYPDATYKKAHIVT